MKQIILTSYLLNHWNSSTAFTFPVCTEYDIAKIAIHPAGNFLIAGDIKGTYIMINVFRKVELDRMYIPNGKPSAISFSPDGRFYAVACKGAVTVYLSPLTNDKEFNVFKKVAAIPMGKVLEISWTQFSRQLLCSCTDLTIQIFEFERNQVATLTGFTKVVIGAWFSRDDDHVSPFLKVCSILLTPFPVFLQIKIICLTKQGVIYVYQRDDSKSVPWSLEKQLNLKFVPASCDFQKNTGLFTVGSKNGTFYLYFFPDFDLVHSLNISDTSITTCSINPTSDWIAFGCKNLGQVLVWEWKSETRKNLIDELYFKAQLCSILS